MHPDEVLRRIQLGQALWRFGRSASFLFLGPIFTVLLVLALLGVVSWPLVLIFLGIGAVLWLVQVIGGAIQQRTRLRISQETSLTLEEYIEAAIERGDLPRAS